MSSSSRPADAARVSEVVEAFETVKNLGKFFKWFSTAAAGALALWIFIKAMARGVFS
jgi:hypothetical protein